MRYHQAIKQIVMDIVLLKMDKKNAHVFIEKEKSLVLLVDQKKFVEVIETELMALHAGNVARYSLNLNEYKVWYLR